jgi:hypothetical protein
VIRGSSKKKYVRTIGCKEREREGEREGGREGEREREMERERELLS